MLGIRIAILRISKGWSQAELARRIGVSTSAVGMYEQGRREPSLGLLVRLAQEFGVTTDYLLMGETPASDPLTTSELPSITVRTEALIRLLSRTMK
jgi:transcriptional regulator with XRE-family HTH domain